MIYYMVVVFAAAGVIITVFMPKLVVFGKNGKAKFGVISGSKLEGLHFQWVIRIIGIVWTMFFIVLMFLLLFGKITIS